VTLPLDQAEPVRAGEELDGRALKDFLARTVPDLGDEPIISQFRQGHSNLTYLVRIGDGEYVLRRPPFGNVVKTAHDMGREFRILTALAPVFSPAPKPLVFCDDPSVIGGPFYLMERRHGVVLRRILPTGFVLTPAVAGHLCRGLVDTLATLHSIDYRAVGLEGFGKPEGYVGRQVKGWTERYRAVETEPVPGIDKVASWLASNQPPESGGGGGAAIIHNDFKFDNVMLAANDPGRVTAVLDWELATVGDPLMDFGSTLAYWVQGDDPPDYLSAAMGPTALPGMWSRRHLAEAYAHRVNADLGDLRFYYVYGLFKLAVIVQQIYARFARGVTKDERFAEFNKRVAMLADEAGRALERGI